MCKVSRNVVGGYLLSAYVTQLGSKNLPLLLEHIFYGREANDEEKDNFVVVFIFNFY